MSKGFRANELSAVYIGNLVQGYNGFVSPDVLNPQQWLFASNVYSGLFEAIRRARFAPVVVAGTTSGFAVQNAAPKSFYHFRDPTPNDLLLSDVSNKLFTFNIASSYAATQRFNPYVDPTGAGVAAMGGVWNRSKMLNQCFEMNGQVKQRSFGALLTSITSWGLDSPDNAPTASGSFSSAITVTLAASPTGAVRVAFVTTYTTTAPHGLSPGQTVTITGVTDTTFNTPVGQVFTLVTAAGSTFTVNQPGFVDATSGSGTVFTGMIKLVGMSYRWAWEDFNANHTSAPSPASAFFVESAGSPKLQALSIAQPGTVTISNSSTLVVGIGTAFTSAWIGRNIAVSSLGQFKRVVSVTNSTNLNVDSAFSNNIGGLRFQIYDPRSTHIKVYATADGGATYFLKYRFALNLTQLLSITFLTDDNNAEPPNAPFTSETAQFFNIPPPIGAMTQEYQSRIVVFQAPLFGQTFFYSNIELTNPGNLPESFAPLNQVTLPIGDGILNGMADLPTGLIIWSNKNDMFKLTGLLSDNSLSSDVQLGAVISRLPYGIGCGSPYTPKVTSLGVFWLTAERRVMLYTDHYAPRDVGITIQDILTQIPAGKLGDARAAYFQTKDKNWYCLAINTTGGSFNNKLLILDLDILLPNGQESSSTFDLATNAPVLYGFDIPCSDVVSAYDLTPTQNLLCGDLDKVTDADYNTGDFTITTEQQVGGSVTLHAFGNEDATQIKMIDTLRYVTNRTPSQLLADGWAFGANIIDDDVFTFQNPDTRQWIPGSDSPLMFNIDSVAADSLTLGTQSPLRYGPNVFKFMGSRAIQGRRFQFSIFFPLAVGNYELRGIHVLTRKLPPR